MLQVIQNIYAVARQAQVIPGFNGPTLGVVYTVSLEEQERRRLAKIEEAAQERARALAESERRRVRREQLEAEDRQEAVSELEERANRRLTRRATKSNLNEDELSLERGQIAERFRQLRTNASETDVSIRPVTFGMDREIQQRVRERECDHDAAVADEKATSSRSHRKPYYERTHTQWFAWYATSIRFG